VLLIVPCPSQVDEGISRFSADYWHEVRVELRRRLDRDLFVLGLCGAAGDQSPHVLVRKREDEEMRRRAGLSERQEIARRLADAVQGALAVTRPEPGEPVLERRCRRLELLPRSVAREDHDWSLAERERCLAAGGDPKGWWPERLREVAAEFDAGGPTRRIPAEMNVLRLGDLGMVTCPFELYLDFAHRIRARSTAPQTAVVQLAGGCGWYLPTERGVQGGHYGSIPAVAKVGPEGGQELVEAALATLAELFPAVPTGSGRG